jgi:hypothetical protein
MPIGINAGRQRVIVAIPAYLTKAIWLRFLSREKAGNFALKYHFVGTSRRYTQRKKSVMASFATVEKIGTSKSSDKDPKKLE